MAIAPTSALGLRIQGMREAKAAFQRLPEVFRERLADATEATAKEIARGAQVRVLSSPSVVTRALYNAIGWKMNRNNGRGAAGVQVGAAGRRAHFVEFGTVKMPAEPFMVPAAEAETQPFLSRVKAAGKQAERDLSIGRNF